MAYCLKVLFKSAHEQTIYIEKMKGTQDLILAVSRRRRKHITS